MTTTNYSNPEVLVETDWVKQNLGKSGIKLVEIDVDTKAYEAGHIPGAVGFNWQTQLQDQVRRDIISQEQFEKLLGGAGISPSNTVVLYGDNNNWFSSYGFWLFKIYGHKDVRLMNGGRVKWLNEPDKELTTELPKIVPAQYRASAPDLSLRALLPEVLRGATGEDLQSGGRAQPRRIYRQSHCAARHVGDRATRRPHSRRQRHPVEHGRRPRWNVQIGGGTARDLR